MQQLTLSLGWKYLQQACSQGDAEVQCTTLNLQKGPLSAKKWVKKFFVFFCMRVKEGEVQKVHFFWVQKVNILGILRLPKIDPVYGPALQWSPWDNSSEI